MSDLYPTGPITSLIRQMSKLQGFREKTKTRFAELTDREVEVLGCVAEGLKNPAIAKKLGITRATVQNHRAAVRGKLGIETHTDYIKFALAYDLIKL
ncbi:MAG: helix-turn-helix transcriptional regulator [Balneolaceae bacterium]